MSMRGYQGAVAVMCWCLRFETGVLLLLLLLLVCVVSCASVCACTDWACPHVAACQATRETTHILLPVLMVCSPDCAVGCVAKLRALVPRTSVHYLF